MRNAWFAERAIDWRLAGYGWLARIHAFVCWQLQLRPLHSHAHCTLAASSIASDHGNVGRGRGHGRCGARWGIGSRGDRGTRVTRGSRGGSSARSHGTDNVTTVVAS